jgi:predicted enzyme related to lactoylglutathione lyase
VQYIDLAGTDGSPVIRFQRVPEPKTVKDRIHLDLRVDDIEEACQRVIEFGGIRVEQGDVREYDVVFRVMLDPEGNEFCLVSYA